MAEPITAITYTDTALPTDGDTFDLWNSFAGGLSDGMLPEMGIQTYGISLEHDQTGTIRGYWSDDGFVTETQFYDSGLIAVPAQTTEIEVPIAGKRQVRFEWVNGGVTQTTFNIQQWISVEVAA